MAYTGLNAEIVTGQNFVKFKQGQVRPAMSGGPLLNLRTGRVCGMVKFTRDRSQALGGGAIPMAVILARLPQLVQASPAVPNPFGATSVITDPSKFWGHQELLRQMFEELGKGGSRALIGPLIRVFRANLGNAAQTPEEQWVQALEMAKIPNAERGQVLRDLLQSWVDEEDEQEQKETWIFLRQALDEDRLSNRPLFP